MCKIKNEGESLLRAIRELSQLKAHKAHNLALLGQPYDSQLLKLSPLFLKSRKLYLSQRGTFKAALVSSPRSLSSTILLENRIEYSPIANELIWSGTDPDESRNPQHALTIRTYTTSLFHEQNHRILWKHLPSAPPNQAALRRYLNFAESLIIVMDMALGDELGEKQAHNFYLTGAIYDPGTSVRAKLRDVRMYRNYLQAALFATYLALELYEPEGILRVIQALYPWKVKGFGSIAERATLRSLNLDPAFIAQTNLVWQKKHKNAIKNALCKDKSQALQLPNDPLDNRLPYLMGEKWFELFGL